METAYRAAHARHLQGDLVGARQGYCDLLQHDPLHADAWHMLGMILYQAGAQEAALECVERAITLQPMHAEQFANLATIYRSVGRSADAIQALELALSLQPDHVNARNTLGVVYLESGQRVLAEQQFLTALERDPNHVPALSNLGNVYQSQGRHADAVLAQRRAVAINPQSSTAWNNLGSALHSLGHFEESLDCFQHAAAIEPYALEPAVSIGRSWIGLGQLDRACAALQATCQGHPNSATAHYYWGLALDLQGQQEASFQQFQIALKLDPDYVHALASRALCLNRSGDIPGAMADIQRAIELRPDLHETHSCKLFLMSGDASHTPQELFDEHCKWGKTHGHVTPIFDHTEHNRDADRVLKVGYVSPDFRQHAVMAYFTPVLQHHDRKHIETFCYSQTICEDQVTQDIKSHAHHWRTTYGLSDEQLARRIHADGIDILVDLAGHTANNRIRAFAHKPAPIQITWLGYPHTTGLSTVDYYITNVVQDPPTESYHVERPIYLRQDTCFQPPQSAPDVSPLPRHTQSHITFGSLHRPTKITSLTLDLWGKVLASEPTSRLILFNTSFTNDSASHITTELQRRNVKSERFEIISQQVGQHYLQIYDRIDIALDVIPWNGGTTTREALWMGVPVVGLYGDRRSARSTAAVLSQMGLSEWIACTPTDYVSLVTQLAHNPPLLNELRMTLRDRMRNQLCDASAFTTILEDTYRDIWHFWCSHPQASVNTRFHSDHSDDLPVRSHFSLVNPCAAPIT